MMKNAIIIAIAVVVIIGLTTAYFLGAFRPGVAPALQGAFTPSLTPAVSLTPPRPSVTLLPSPTANLSVSPFVTTGNATSAPANVDFALSITGVTQSGLSATVTADLINNGTSTAHIVSVKVEVFSGGSRVQISGQDFLTVPVGTLGPGAKATKQVTLEFGFMDGMKMAQSGADFVLTVSSDEKTRTFNYSYKP